MVTENTFWRRSSWEVCIKDEIIVHLRGSLAKWQLPNDVIFVDELPYTATGKILKTKLRAEYSDCQLPTAAD